MPSPTFTFYQDFKEQVGKGIHDLSTHDIKVALTNTAASDNLIGYLDYGSSITLADTESVVLDFTTSIFTDT